MATDLLSVHDGVVIVSGFFWELGFTVGPRPRSQRVDARFLGAGFLDVESVEQCIEAIQGYGLVAQRTERTRRDLTSEVSPEVPVATKRMCIVDRT